MSKVIKSPVEKWAGSVTIADPLTLTQARLIEAGMKEPVKDIDGKVWFSTMDEAMLPAIIACGEKWNLSNMPETITVETFPASPRKASHKLINWLSNEIVQVYTGELEIPNESNPTLIAP
jgi:hypothetical protein